MMDFVAWPKIPRLKKGMVVTEKIDGTNAAVIVEKLGVQAGDYDTFLRFVDPGTENRCTVTPTLAQESYQGALVCLDDGELYLVGAQSRNRLITPEVDNAGFARWAFENAEELVKLLGVGHHYGEWWGSGIQRGYGLTNGQKKFSLFNIHRYHQAINVWGTPLDDVIGLVPHLYSGDFSIDKVDEILEDLRLHGSKAARGYMNPEGVVIYHSGAGTTWKAFVDPKVEAKPKGETKADYKLAAPAGG